MTLGEFIKSLIGDQGIAALAGAAGGVVRWLTLRSRLWLVASLAVVAGIAIAALWRMGGLSSVMPPQDVALDADLCVVAPPTPYDPASGLGPTEARPVPPDARCPCR